MNQFEYTEVTIDKDVKEVFSSIREDIQQNYLCGESDLEHAKNLLCKHVPELVKNKSLILLDTAFNYLTKDALKILETSNDQTINEFYEQNQRMMETLKKEFKDRLAKKEMSLSSNLRMVYSGIAGAGGGVAGKIIGDVAGKAIGEVFFSSTLSWMLALAFAIGAFFVTYKKTTSFFIDKVKQELDDYLDQAQEMTSKGVHGVITDYKNYFAT